MVGSVPGGPTITPDERAGTVPHELYDTVRSLNGATSAETVHQTTVDGASRLLDGARCKLAFVDGDELIARASSASGPPAAPTRLPLSDDVVGGAFRRREAVLVEDHGAVRSASAATTVGTQCRTVLCVPFGDDGLLVAASPDRAAFSDAQFERVRSLAAAAETAVDRVESPRPASTEDRLETVADVLSHDVVSPMNVAQGFLERARMADDREELERVDSALVRLEELIAGLVTFIRSGRPLDDIEPVELAAAARRSWAASATDGANLTLHGTAVILADRNGLCELLENLFRNATAHGGPGITVNVGPLESGTGFYVEDDGPGIPTDQRDDVFEDGYSATDSGSGVGLGIVRRLVEAHGWTISVAEGGDGGARFEVTGVERPAS